MSTIPSWSDCAAPVAVALGQDNDVTRPWVVWGHGLSRAWLFAKLEAGAQVVILPPWTDGGFAGLPPIRAIAAPCGAVRLEENQYAVSANSGIEPTPAWQEYGLFEKSKIAWLVAHEPFVGAGRAWLCTAELLVSTPTTRPKEARRLTVDLLTFIANRCKKPKPANSCLQHDRARTERIHSQRCSLPAGVSWAARKPQDSESLHGLNSSIGGSVLSLT